MWNQLIRRSPSKANGVRARQTTATVASRAKEASMAGRSGSKRARLPATGVVLLAALGLCVSAASSQDQAPERRRHFTRRRTARASAGSSAPTARYRTSNVKALKAGSKIFYFQQASETALDSDIVIYVRRGTVATGHCFLRSATGIGLCTISNGTGKLAGFHLRVRVAADTSIPKLFHWDGTYSFGKG